MNKHLALLCLLPIFAVLHAQEEKEKPYPKTVDEAADIAISWLDEESKSKIRRTYPGSMGVYHFGWGMGLRNSLPIWGNEALLEDAGGKHPDDVSAVVMERAREKLYQKLDEEEKERIEAFMQFLKQTKVPSLGAATYAEFEKNINEAIMRHWKVDQLPYQLKFTDSLEKQTPFKGGFKNLTLDRIMEFMIYGAGSPVYFQGSDIIIEIK